MISKRIYILLLSLASLTWAQVSATVDVSSYLDDNLFRSPEPTSDLLTNTGLKLGFQQKESPLQLYYEGRFFLYRDLNERNFTLQSLGLNYFSPFGKDDRHGFYFGADLTMRINGQDYDYYNYSQFYAYANLNYNFNYFFFKTGYNFRYRNYSNFPDLTNARHYAFVQLNKPFPTKTTVILEADLGHKSFSGSEVTIYSAGSGGMRGFGRHLVTYYPEETTVTSQIPSMTHFILLARIAQSLHPKVGVFVQYRKQISLTDETDYLNSTAYYQDEELYDDPFSYESDGVNGQLTWILPGKTRLKFGGGAISKRYISEHAFVSAEDSTGSGGLRADDGLNWFVSLQKTFYFKKNWIQALQFELNYNYIRNQSNSYWYDYKNTIIGGGITWQF